jgi:nucleoside-diphosphate-sugar epimerase
VTKLKAVTLPAKFIGFSEETRTESREIVRRCPDITRAREVLGYTPAMDIDAGLHSVISFREGLSRSKAR